MIELMHGGRLEIQLFVPQQQYGQQISLLDNHEAYSGIVTRFVR